MAFSSQPLRRKSSTGFNTVPEHDDGGLTQSLSNLSLDPHDRQDYSPRAKPPTPLKPPRSRHSSPSPNRPLSRSTSRGRDSDGGVGTNEGGRTLLRKASTNSLRSANGVTPGRAPSRRSSYGAGLTPSSPSATSTFPVAVEKPPVTAASVAHDYFTAEYEGLHDSEARPKTNAIVILNDAVYGHRFSRPRTSRSALATIVERPERVRAAVLGLSMAYVRLGERHSEGSMPVHPKTDIHVIDRVPFRIQKTTRRMPLNSPAVTNVHGLKWMEELTMMCTSAEAKLAMGGKELQRPELDRGSQGAPAKLHEGDLYLCSESLNAMEGAMGAVCEAVDVVFTTGPRTAFVGIRPPGHHCSASYPSGFCWVNNVHVGIMHGILNHGLTHAAIIDFDLHHGDGSQAITWQHNTRSVGARKNDAPWKKTSIGYFSLHDINSYPCEGGDEDKVKNASLCIDNAHGQTIWNVHLQSWKTEQDFWKLYEGQYNVILEKTRSYLKTQSEKVRATGQTPKAAIFFSAGFDASEWESAGMQRHQVNVPTEFYARLGEDVVSMAAEEGLCVDGRVISVLEGGYSDRALASGVLSHMSGLAAKRASRVSKTQGKDDMDTPGEPQDLVYDPAWWSSAELDRLENHMTNPPTPPKKPRYNVPPTYSSPTQASTAKVAEPIKIRRSFSGMSQNNGAMPIRSISPPPPEVPWPVAAHELSKVLIPSERQTESCKPEDLNAEATKARRDRQSQLLGNAWPAPPVPEQPTRMALRGRKPKPIARKPQAAARATPSRTPRAQPNASRRTSRRLSASALLSPTKEGPEQGIPDVPAIPPAAFEDHRPSSAVSAETPTTGKLAIKKTRPATTGKPAPARAARGGKKSTVAGPSRTASSGASTGGQSRDELDNITTGMKKIKINLITQAQREAKEKAKREASSGFSTPVEENQGSMSPTPGSIPMPASSPPLPDEAGFSGGMDMFIPYQPEGPSPVAVSQTEPLKWLPPNAGASVAGTPVGTPSPVKRHHNLFNQATGISFAPRGENKNGPQSEGLSSGASEEKKEEKEGVTMSSIPETPK
ncbi:Arginase/deacetylase [Sarocladium strictum]